MILWELFLGFLKVGCFSFGGAYSAIPLIRDVVRANGWMTEETLADLIAVSESTPGPIMVNLATFIGNTQGGILGAVIATAAVVLPAFLIILLLTALLKATLKNRWVQAVLNGLIPCILAMILATGTMMIFNNCFPRGETASFGFDWRAAVLTAVLAAVLYLSKPIFRKKIPPIPFILLSAALGIGICAL